ncbi:MAG: FMN-binding protein [Patescibacteria group bacterium]
MKKTLLSLALILTFGAYTAFLRSDITSKLHTPIVPVTTPDPSPITQTPSPTPTTPTPAPTTPPSNTGKFKNGTYTGDSVDAFYGNVQVSAIISGGQLTNVTFLDYPRDRRTSLQKSNQAMPILKSEAISSQSANVNSVSGATYTSEAFTLSLTSALNQAKNI